MFLFSLVIIFLFSNQLAVVVSFKESLTYQKRVLLQSRNTLGRSLEGIVYMQTFLIFLYKEDTKLTIYLALNELILVQFIF